MMLNFIKAVKIYRLPIIKYSFILLNHWNLYLKVVFNAITTNNKLLFFRIF